MKRSRKSRAPAILAVACALLASGCAGGAKRSTPAEPGLARSPSASPMSRAYDLLNAGRAAEAEGVLRDILREDPRNRQARLELAYLEVRAKRWKSAVVLLGDLLEADPADMRLRMELGYARQASGALAAAADDFAIVARGPSEFQDQAREALAVLAWQQSPEARAIASNALIDRGYGELGRGETAAARESFRDALRADPGRAEVAKQLGYMSLADGDPAGAAKEFSKVRRLFPQDHRTALELGYVYDSLHDEAGAERSFEAAAASPDSEIREAAEAALRNIRGRKDPYYVDVYAAPTHTTRFSDTILSLEVVAGYKPPRWGPLSAYLASRLTQDSRSRSGTRPDIYSDNLVSLAPGLRLQPKGYNLSLTAEWGLSVNLLRSQEHPHATQADGRVVLSDYHYWGGPVRTFVDLGGSLGHYDRYHGNIILDLQLRGGIEVWDNGVSQLSVYGPVKLLKDRNRDFYNNLFEVGLGAEFQPATKVNLKARVERLFGRYAGVSGRDPNPYGPRYADWRATLLYSAHFSWERQPSRKPRKARNAYLW
ncbi:MAG: tetratricopeptide repeat protein [Elusimicrobia bacterium]|nr:tetratricopeptide repeat protein [Elusimicrobiota bacterium]